jgi:hypothetical protein
MREALGLFDDSERLQEAVKELERTDFPRDSISIMGDADAIKKKFGHPLESERVQDDPDIERNAPVRSEERVLGLGVLVTGTAYIGAMAAALAAGAVTIPAIIGAAAIGGTGGAAIGGVLAKLLGDHFDSDLEERVKKGGLLLWVRTPDAEKEEIAQRILNEYGARHVRVHDI